MNNESGGNVQKLREVWKVMNYTYSFITGQSIPIPHSGPFSHLTFFLH